MFVTTALIASLCVPQSTGPMVGTPHVISVAPGTTGGTSTTVLSESEVWVKQAGVVSMAPAPLPGGPVLPDFRIATIMSGLVAYPDIDATSIGFDFILADNLGKMIVSPLGWGMITFSVSRTAVGDSGGRHRGSRLRRERPGVPRTRPLGPLVGLPTDHSGPCLCAAQRVDPYEHCARRGHRFGT